jgi:hypothetical protein
MGYDDAASIISLPPRSISIAAWISQPGRLYAESLPAIGEAFDGNGGYKHAGGHFRFTGPGFETVRLAALEVMARYFVLGEAAAG